MSEKIARSPPLTAAQGSNTYYQQYLLHLCLQKAIFQPLPHGTVGTRKPNSTGMGTQSGDSCTLSQVMLSYSFDFVHNPGEPEYPRLPAR